MKEKWRFKGISTEKLMSFYVQTEPSYDDMNDLHHQNNTSFCLFQVQKKQPELFLLIYYLIF